MAESNLALRQMVEGFRVNELQQVLVYANRSKNGKKKELLEKVVRLIDSGNITSSIAVKIRDLYQQSRPWNGPMTTLGHASGSGGGTHISQYQRNYQMQPQQVVPPTRLNIPIRPLPFFNQLHQLLPPTLVPTERYSMDQTFVVHFNLSAAQLQQIRDAPKKTFGAITEGVVQVHVRFFNYPVNSQPTEPLSDELPSCLALRCNEQIVTLPQQKACRPNEEARRPGGPINITAHCKLRDPSVANKLTISWKHSEAYASYNKHHAVAVYIHHRFNSVELQSQVEKKGFIHGDHTRAMIKKYFKDDADIGIVTPTYKIPLKDNTQLVRMTIPARASTCNHVICFDLLGYLMMNEKKPTWQCPVCYTPINFANIRVDGLLHGILTKYQNGLSVTFKKDLSWSIEEEEASDGENSDDSGSRSNGAKSQPKLEKRPAAGDDDILEILSSDEENEVAVVPAPTRPAYTAAASSSQAVVIIDSDDEDSAPAARQQPAGNPMRQPLPAHARQQQQQQARTTTQLSSIAPRSCAQSSARPPASIASTSGAVRVPSADVTSASRPAPGNGDQRYKRPCPAPEPVRSNCAANSNSMGGPTSMLFGRPNEPPLPYLGENGQVGYDFEELNRRLDEFYRKPPPVQCNDVSTSSYAQRMQSYMAPGHVYMEPPPELLLNPGCTDPVYFGSNTPQPPSWDEYGRPNFSRLPNIEPPPKEIPFPGRDYFNNMTKAEVEWRNDPANLDKLDFLADASILFGIPRENMPSYPLPDSSSEEE